MKFKALTLLLVSALILNIACQKEDEPIPPIPFFDVKLAITPYPANGTSNLSFQTTPLLAFSKQLDYEYYDIQNSIWIKPVFDSTYIVNASYQKVSTTPTFNSRKDTLRFTSTEGFNANSSYTIKFHYHIEARRKQTDKYEVLQQDGAPFAGKFESSFGIKDYIFSIDTSNVEYAYPWPYQYHFLKDETNEGVLLLKNNQEYDQYFKDATFKVRFYSPVGLICENNVTYNLADRKYKFLIPTESFENSTIYKVEFKMIDNKSKSETTFLTYHFRTSKFNNFSEKINTAYNVNLSQQLIYQGVYLLYRNFELAEPFDLAEGKTYNGLIQFDAIIDTSNNLWMKQFNWFYEGLKTSQLKYRIERPNSLLKIPPTNDIVFDQNLLSPILNKDNIQTEQADDYSQTQQKIIYRLNQSSTRDFAIAQACVFGIPQSQLTQWEYNLREYSFCNLKLNCYYPFKIQYIVDNKVTSNLELSCYFW